MKFTRLPKLSLLSACACAALSTMPAWAAPVLSSGSSAQTTGLAVMGTNGPLTGYTSSASQAPSGLAGTASASGWASQHGAYAVSSSAEGFASASSFVKLIYSLTNNNATAQQYSMNFHIYGGQLSAGLNTYNGITAPFATNEFLKAGYETKVSVTKNSVTSTAFASKATVTNEAPGVAVVTQTGTTLTGATANPNGYYSWNTADYFVDLGTLGVGETFSVQIDLTDFVEANVGTYDFGSGGSGYGGYGGGNECSGPTLPTRQPTVSERSAGNLCFKGRANVFYGDPINFSNSGPDIGANFGFNAITGVNAEVPEPGSLSLAALALLGAGAALRRRKR